MIKAARNVGKMPSSSLLDLMDQPRQLEGVDTLANLFRRAIAVGREHRDHLIA